MVPWPARLAPLSTMTLPPSNAPLPATLPTIRPPDCTSVLPVKEPLLPSNVNVPLPIWVSEPAPMMEPATVVSPARSKFTATLPLRLMVLAALSLNEPRVPSPNCRLPWLTVKVLAPEAVTAPLRVSIWGPFCASEPPVRLRSLENVLLALWLKISVALSTSTLPLPSRPPSPTCSAPALTVVPPL